MNDPRKIIHDAIDLKDAVERHSRNVDSDDYKLREEVYNKAAWDMPPFGEFSDKDHGELDEEFYKDHPSRVAIAKLLDTRDKMAQAGLRVTPEEREWREEVDTAIQQAEGSKAN